MSPRARNSAATVTRLVRRVTPARWWRGYAVGAVAVALAVFGVAMAVSAPSAHAARDVAARADAASSVCTPPASPPLAGFKQGQVAIPGDSVHYVIGGSGPVLILMHGWPMTWWEWHTVMPALAKAHTVIAFDLPGLGNSSVPTSGPYTTNETAYRLHQAVVALGYAHVSILAHDLGVGVGYAYARLYPSQVSRLMVLDSLLNGFGLESIYGDSFHFLLNMAAPPTPEHIINNSEAEQAYLNFLYLYAYKPGAITQQDRDIWYGAYSCPNNREAGYNYYRAFPQDETFDLNTDKTKLTLPVAAMGGQYSFGTATAASMRHVDTDVHAIVAPGSGHYIAEEDPDFLAECASIFFSSSAHPHAPSGYAACLP